MNLTATHKEWAPISEGDRVVIKEELERILASAHFRSSRRYPSLLRYVVEKRLSGQEHNLKERTLGIDVFHRAADYDTNADPVVRFSAGEVRRRLAQYYQENSGPGSVEIALPAGSYVPQFFRIETAEGEGSSSAVNVTQGFVRPRVIDRELQVRDGAAYVPQNNQNSSQPPSRWIFLAGLLTGALAISALALIGYFLFRQSSTQSARTPLMELWGPLITSPDAVIISVGRTRVEDPDAREPLNATIEQHILRPEARISLAAVQAVSQVAGFLQTQHKQFRIHEADSNTLQDLHRRPVTLISGYNNLWTMRLLRPLRFHLDQTGSLHYIVDSQHPERREWSVDFNMPYLQETVDYAIIGRFEDPTTDGPVVIVAGIGSNGSQAAGEFMISPAALDALARYAPHHSLGENFEAVLKVEVIGGNTGAATVVASQFW